MFHCGEYQCKSGFEYYRWLCLVGRDSPLPAKKLIMKKLKNKIDKISEIRIEEVIDKENEENYYWVYFVRNGKIEVIGKSCQKPQCYRQVAVYQWIIF